MQGLYFEDIFVNQVFETKEITVSRADILDFAGTFDPNPFHLDKNAATQLGFPDIIASGMHTLSLSMKLFFELKLWDEAILPSPGLENVRWHRSVFPDTHLYVKATVRQILPSTSKPDRGIIKIHQETLDKTTNQALMTVDVMHRLRRRRPGSNPGSPLQAKEVEDKA
ncbi:MaoC/PaaZ C-terminal domain-containing protein [Pseudotabrizicola sp. 4114]|uniref:MaoC/PaaZ C-terminal domain-containing protein n=1 Tax=Pseudotabrizicola sp. 4114 TaxID=2817731 RepID=UPI0028671C41|nr:acyl dehydratase [Pseudorhodobacter sp. 4114]